MSIPIYLDCDTGIDDALALAYLLARPEAQLVGIGTVSGNASAAQAARNTLDLLQLAGRNEVGVAVGAHDPLAGAYAGGAPHVHGVNGIGDIEIPRSPREPEAEDAATMLIRLAHAHPGELQVLAIGPLTNLAVALDRDPTIAALVAHVTIMGGAALAPGNITPVAEANIYHDAEAAARVLSADWDVTLVPLDVTMTHRLTETQVERIAAAGVPFDRALAGMSAHYFGFYEPIFGLRVAALHDPLAAMLAVGALTITSAPTLKVVVDDTHGPGRGQTICDTRRRYTDYREQPRTRCRVVLEVGTDVAEHLVETLVGRITGG